jgi:hypothetical protein
MKIYIVSGAINYEGHDCYSTRWFLSYDKAEEYGEELVKGGKFDFYEIMEGEEGQELG